MCIIIRNIQYIANDIYSGIKHLEILIETNQLLFGLTINILGNYVEHTFLK